MKSNPGQLQMSWLTDQENIVERYTRNTRGRDFVVGDIHGMIELFREALKEVAFDPIKDRVFSAGDLIDRGPASEEVIELIYEPWFHAVKGNHEDLMLGAIDGDESKAGTWIANGGIWFADVCPSMLNEYYKKISELPIAIEIETTHGTVGVIHADVPYSLSWPELLEKLEQKDQKIISYSIWSRIRATDVEDGDNTPDVDGVWRVYCGHTIMDKNNIHCGGNVYFIDTGAYQETPNSRLTLVDITHPDPRELNIAFDKPKGKAKEATLADELTT